MVSTPASQKYAGSTVSCIVRRQQSMVVKVRNVQQQKRGGFRPFNKQWSVRTTRSVQIGTLLDPVGHCRSWFTAFLHRLFFKLRPSPRLRNLFFLLPSASPTTCKPILSRQSSRCPWGQYSYLFSPRFRETEQEWVVVTYGLPKDIHSHSLKQFPLTCVILKTGCEGNTAPTSRINHRSKSDRKLLYDIGRPKASPQRR